jgi:hypothetical protein
MLCNTLYDGKLSVYIPDPFSTCLDAILATVSPLLKVYHPELSIYGAIATPNIYGGPQEGTLRHPDRYIMNSLSLRGILEYSKSVVLLSLKVLKQKKNHSRHT